HPRAQTSTLSLHDALPIYWMAANGRKAGIMVRQVEDEIGVVNMAIGAAHAGLRAMCATSGGGFALMSEGLGMSAMMETPVVVIKDRKSTRLNSSHRTISYA